MEVHAKDNLSALFDAVEREKEKITDQGDDDFASNEPKSKRERASWEQRLILEKLFQTNQVNKQNFTLFAIYNELFSFE